MDIQKSREGSMERSLSGTGQVSERWKAGQEGVLATPS